MAPRRAARVAAFAFLLCSADDLAGAEADGPRNYEELRVTLPEAPEARAEALAAFARESRASLSDRLLALGAWRRALDRQDPAQVDVDLYEAHLRAVGQSPSLRKKAQRSARSRLVRLAAKLAPEKEPSPGKTRSKTSKRSQRSKRNKRNKDPVVDEAAMETVKERLAHVEDVLGGDQDLERLRQITARRSGAPRTAPTAREAQVVAKLEEALPHYTALDDVRVLAEARLAIALFFETTDRDRAEVDRLFSDLVRVGGRDRDTAPVREAVRRARARVLTEMGRFPDAVHESLVADRAVSVPSHLAAFEKPPATAYSRSKASADLCASVRAHGIRCSEVEKGRMGDLTFYDYSQEQLPAFDPERARTALDDYQPLLMDCISAAAKSGRSLDGVHLELEWSIGLDGRVGEHTLLPRRLRDSPLDACLTSAFAKFRYPRYRGEMQHTQLAFDVGG